MQSRNWCFTTNNFTPEHVLWLSTLVKDGKADYLVFGKEVGEEGTPHLQGYVEVPKRLRLNQVRKLIPDSHLSVAKGTAAQNFAYCSKEGIYEEFGSSKRCQGKRSDLTAFRDAVKSGERDRAVLLEEYPEVVAKYPQFVSTCLDTYQPVAEIPDHALYPWQVILQGMLERPADDRTIIFVIDHEGNKGKTWFARHYCKTNDDAQYMEMGRKSDMAYALETDIRVLFVNCSRQMVEHMNYGLLESIKDGVVFSPKYQSKTRYLSNKVHVVVMMNEEPDMTKLSKDRYKLIYP